MTNSLLGSPIYNPAAHNYTSRNIKKNSILPPEGTRTMATNSTADRALTLLGSGLGPEVVASALGVSTSYISQLLSDDQFCASVAELRFKSLSKHNERDNSYDAIEDTLLEKMRDLMPLMMRPMEILAAIKVINAAKRRGSSAPEHITNKSTVLQLNMPTKIIQHFTTNINNQVITTGQQDLTTIQSGSMDSLLKNKGVTGHGRTLNLAPPGFKTAGTSS